MNEEQLSHARHTLAHLLAAAVRELYPHAKPTIGPAIDTGFYYDFDFGTGDKPGEQNLGAIEQKMREILKRWDSIEGEPVSPEHARDVFAGNEYKRELIDEILERNKPVTLYHSKHGDETVFTDLCRGGHTEHPRKEIAGGGFKLERIAGAYWRGDETKPMLTRIYGLAFASKDDLAAYLHQQEEAKKRDHRKLGKELGLFVFSELVGPGLPLWTPKGTIVRDELNEFVWSLRKARGYERVTIPHITKKNLYEKSGHWDKYAADLFKVATREGNEYAMKPMNCPHHAQIFDAEPRSYRAMPQRYAETTMVYRDEQSGELSGLSRVLSITQDDAHVFCRENQIEAEVFAIWDIINTFYGTFGFTLTPRFSRHDPTHPEKYLGGEEVWKKAEDAILALMTKRGVTDYIDGPGEAAIYGPKIDFMAKDAIGRTHQVATIQLDFNQPANFDLTCVNERGEKERVVMIHAAIMGSIERFLSVILEHLGGELPFWLAPVQLRVIPVSDVHRDACVALVADLRAADIRAECDASDDSLGKRIRAASMNRLPAHIVVGDKELEHGTFTVEWRTGQKDLLPREDLVRTLGDVYRTRSR